MVLLFYSHNCTAKRRHSQSPKSPQSTQICCDFDQTNGSSGRLTMCVCLGSFRILLWKWMMRDLSSEPTALRTISFCPHTVIYHCSLNVPP